MMLTQVESPEDPPTRSVRTASIVTLGCKLNQAESFRIQSELAGAGVAIRPFGEPVDLSIVNTCTVTHVADQQARQALRRAARTSPGGFVVAMGCYAQVAPEEVARVAGVDLVIPSDKERLVEQLETVGFRLGPDGAGPDDPVPLPASRVRQFVKVQDGCDDYCTYCIVPFARGHALSRSADDIVGEVHDLETRGCREVVLTGVQIGAYGQDRYRLRQAGLVTTSATTSSLPPMASGPARPLAALVRRLLEETTIGRIRISSIQPQDWPDDFIDLFGDPRVCHHLHLPLQSGCDHTLRRMSRRYSTAEFASLVERVRRAVPDIALTADMIVGFPGETEADHNESLRFSREMRFAAIHVFRYSPRAGTAASRMADQILAGAKQQRSQEMRAVADELSGAFRSRFLGSTLSVLWEEELPIPPDSSPSFPRKRESTRAFTSLARRHWTGLTSNYLRVNAESMDDWLGHEMPMHLVAADGDGLLGVPWRSHE
jgi:threonylcarbamoyladenosine tRNA methylthiotransferase MtaB